MVLYHCLAPHVSFKQLVMVLKLADGEIMTCVRKRKLGIKVLILTCDNWSPLLQVKCLSLGISFFFGGGSH